METYLQELADKIKALTPLELKGLSELLPANFKIKPDSGGGDGHNCPQGEIWNGTECVPNL